MKRRTSFFAASLKGLFVLKYSPAINMNNLKTIFNNMYGYLVVIIN